MERSVHFKEHSVHFREPIAARVSTTSLDRLVGCTRRRTSLVVLEKIEVEDWCGKTLPEIMLLR
jgi:hypothetical protein